MSPALDYTLTAEPLLAFEVPELPPRHPRFYLDQPLPTESDSLIQAVLDRSYSMSYYPCIPLEPLLAFHSPLPNTTRNRPSLNQISVNYNHALLLKSLYISSLQSLTRLDAWSRHEASVSKSLHTLMFPTLTPGHLNVMQRSRFREAVSKRPVPDGVSSAVSTIVALTATDPRVAHGPVISYLHQLQTYLSVGSGPERDDYLWRISVRTLQLVSDFMSYHFGFEVRDKGEVASTGPPSGDEEMGLHILLTPIPVSSNVTMEGSPLVSELNRTGVSPPATTLLRSMLLLLRHTGAPLESRLSILDRLLKLQPVAPEAGRLTIPGQLVSEFVRHLPADELTTPGGTPGAILDVLVNGKAWKEPYALSQDEYDITNEDFHPDEVSIRTQTERIVLEDYEGDLTFSGVGGLMRDPTDPVLCASAMEALIDGGRPEEAARYYDSLGRPEADACLEAAVAACAAAALKGCDPGGFGWGARAVTYYNELHARGNPPGAFTPPEHGVKVSPRLLHCMCLAMEGDGDWSSGVEVLTRTLFNPRNSAMREERHGPTDVDYLLNKSRAVAAVLRTCVEAGRPEDGLAAALGVCGTDTGEEDVLLLTDDCTAAMIECYKALNRRDDALQLYSDAIDYHNAAPASPNFDTYLWERSNAAIVPLLDGNDWSGRVAQDEEFVKELISDFSYPFPSVLEALSYRLPLHVSRTIFRIGVASGYDPRDFPRLTDKTFHSILKDKKYEIAREFAATHCKDPNNDEPTVTQTRGQRVMHRYWYLNIIPAGSLMIRGIFEMISRKTSVVTNERVIGMTFESKSNNDAIIFLAHCVKNYPDLLEPEVFRHALTKCGIRARRGRCNSGKPLHLSSDPQELEALRGYAAEGIVMVQDVLDLLGELQEARPGVFAEDDLSYIFVMAARAFRALRSHRSIQTLIQPGLPIELVDELTSIGLAACADEGNTPGQQEIEWVLEKREERSLEVSEALRKQLNKLGM